MTREAMEAMGIKALEQEPCEDCISRQAVLKIQAKYAEYIGATKFWQMRDDIRALSPVAPQPKYEDIAKADIAKAFQFGVAFGFGKRYDELDRVIEEIKKVITPQPKTGHWIGRDASGTNFYGKCSCCGQEIQIDAWFTANMNYCPNCGAKMIEPQESEET